MFRRLVLSCVLGLLAQAVRAEFAVYKGKTTLECAYSRNDGGPWRNAAGKVAMMVVVRTDADDDTAEIVFLGLWKDAGGQWYTGIFNYGWLIELPHGMWAYVSGALSDAQSETSMLLLGSSQGSVASVKKWNGTGQWIGHDDTMWTELGTERHSLRLDNKLTAEAAGAADMDAAVDVVTDYLESKGYAQAGK